MHSGQDAHFSVSWHTATWDRPFQYQMHLDLPSPIWVPSSWESTCINASMSGCDVRSTKALQNLLRPSLVFPKSHF